MAIQEAQLETWSHQGAVTQSRDTYATIKRALEDNSAPYAGQSYTSFLQGSYANDTNVYADSDVDIVMRLDSIYYSDVSQLSEGDRAAYNAAWLAASYSLEQFKTDVIAHLKRKFGDAAVTPGKKAISIKGQGARRDADVLVCAEFRRYFNFSGSANQWYEEGICFFRPDGTRIENFPRQHSENCTRKHQISRQWFKRTVRVYKNLRNRMIEDGMIEEGLAPSYYLEGMLYNVPPEKFGGSQVDNFTDTFRWIVLADRSKFVCANEQFYLFNDYSPVTWRAANCEKFLGAVNLWTKR
jgi:hypothetical protein